MRIRQISTCHEARSSHVKDPLSIHALGLVAIGFLGLGQVFTTATALALERVPYAAGTGSAVLGTVQSAFGAAVAPLMGITGGHTVVPLFLGMTACALIAVLALLLTRHRGAATAS
ncbi:hypothetical protein [Streptomyces sp. NPDC046821]|uniref:hypothetical protein n=1 Tax=Streptomyces sp. NPDC046821 TaxID=3154702 RepID=UPI0033C86E3D